MEVLLSGALFGFLSSTPIGPINLWLLAIASKQGMRASIAFVFGVVLADLLVAATALWGTHVLVWTKVQASGFQIACAVLFIIFGLLLMFRSTAKWFEPSVDPTASRYDRNFGSGFILCALNPGFLIFWTSAIGVLQKSSNLPLTLESGVLFLSGVAIGDCVWFSVLTQIARRWKNSMTKMRYYWLQKIIGLIMIGFGLLALQRGI